MNKLLLAIIAASSLHMAALAQHRNNPTDSIFVDSIWHIGVAKIVDYNETREQIHADSALHYFRHTLHLIDSLHLTPNFIYEAWLRIGEIYILMKKLDTGKSYFSRVIGIYQAAGDKGREARTWLRLGIKLQFAGVPNSEIPVDMNKALTLYGELNNKAQQAEVLHAMAGYYFWIKNSDSAESVALRAEPLYKPNPDIRHLENSGALAQIYQDKGDLNKALSYEFENVNGMITLGDTTSIGFATAMSGLASVYYDAKEYDKALTACRRSLRICLTLGSPARGWPVHTFLAAEGVVECLTTMGKGQEAYREALHFAATYPARGYTEKGQLAEMMGEAYEAVGKMAEAERSYLEMLRCYRAAPPIGIVGLDAWGPKTIAEFYIRHNRYTDARAILNEAYMHRSMVDMSKAFDIDNEMAYYRLDSAKGDWASALNHYRRAKTMSDSLFDAARSREMTEMEVKYETVQKEKNIEQLERDSRQQQQRVAEANKARNLTLAGTLLLLVLIALLYKSFRLNLGKNKALKDLLEEKEELLTEKEWLLREIHHRVKNNLQIVMGLLQRQSAYIDNEAALSAIQDSENRMHSISLIHQKLYQSNTLQCIAIPEYIDELIRYLSDSWDLRGRIVFEKQFDDIHLDVAQAVPLGLILNEALTNAIKYGYPNGATGIIRVSLLRKKDESLELVIRDSGAGLPAGFDPCRNDSLGMSLMRGLSKQLGGTFELSQSGSTPSHSNGTPSHQDGVTIRVRFRI